MSVFETAIAMDNLSCSIALVEQGGSVLFRVRDYRRAPANIINVALRPSDALRIAKSIIAKVETVKPNFTEMLAVSAAKAAARAASTDAERAEIGADMLANLSPETVAAMERANEIAHACAAAPPAPTRSTAKPTDDEIRAKMEESIRNGDPDFILEATAPITDLLPLRQTETGFLRFWRAFPSLTIEEAASAFAEDMERMAAEAAKREPWFGVVEFHSPDGSTGVIYSVTRETRETAYADCLKFVYEKPASQLFNLAISVAARREFL